MKLVDSETDFLARGAGEFSFTLEQERSFIQGCLDDQTRQFLIAEVEGRIVGNATVALVSNNERYKHRAAMGIAICKEFWQLGIGGKLMTSSIEWCKDNGLEQLELDVVTDNKRAIHVYEKFGFKSVGTKIHAMKYKDGRYADEYSMILFL